jgi:cation-dependent mannose-6-phosphate receptor
MLLGEWRFSSGGKTFGALERELGRQQTTHSRLHADTLCHSLENTVPIFRGRKLILNYTGGSLCPSSKSKREPVALLDNTPREIIGDDPDDDDKPSKKKPGSDTDKSARRKTTVMSLLCDSDPLAKTSISFVAAVDECTYFFEGRSPYACGGVHQAKQALGPGGVFSVIIIIAILVYFVGGCVYQRTVMHQRGWRQLPNYAMWAGIYRFVAVSILKSCLQIVRRLMRS